MKNHQTVKKSLVKITITDFHFEFTFEHNVPTEYLISTICFLCYTQTHNTHVLCEWENLCFRKGTKLTFYNEYSSRSRDNE